MARRKKKKRIPKKYIYVDRDFKTTYVQNKKTGKLRGRKSVKGRGDGTAVRRVRKGRYAGHIFGRTKRIPVKGSKKRRGTLRRI
jgi:hypothetical protein